ncbi:UDP-N-acetylmuramoylalanyl-D-glutamyl-2,6-diaminopimelate--D-alanyl-D-alanine ligase [Paremcibacter congregatus]|uniref:UDP-N-acetylmuramoylalanyl-D-glutamyl-2, 6-diaminopimelate--D-alanyl-D-alanine ligase n=1 Tax=Paremcibacter congregatus TaxID=2043170 RepID=UPI003A9045DD
MSLTPLWSSAEVAKVLDCREEASWQCQGVSIDSRTVEAGDLFFALIGPHSDGHDYVKMAVARGAVAAVVSKPVKGLDPKFQVKVDDVQQALNKLGEAGRARVDIPIIAVTGSVGKTGTKEALKCALSRNKKVHASVLSYNNDIGVPLSLARMPRDVDYGIFELGMNHAGELGPLSKMVRPHVAMITTVELAHSEFFENIEAIADAKAEIFEGLEPGGTVILNHDNPQFTRLSDAAKTRGIDHIISFGSDESAHIHVIRQVFHPTCSCVIAQVMGQIMTFKVGMLGHHWVMNSLAILGAVKAVNGDLGLAGLGLAEMQPLKGRGRRHQIFLDPTNEASILLIDESYNANPASMRAALQTLQQTTPQHKVRRIAVLGDMGELGDQSAMLHAALADVLKEKNIDRVYMVGPQMKHLSDRLDKFRNAGHFPDREALESALLRDLRSGDVVMVKGSNASGMGKVVDKILDLEEPVAKQAAAG